MFVVLLLSVGSSKCDSNDKNHGAETKHKAEVFDNAPQLNTHSSLKKQKRSLGLLASIFHRAMTNEVQDYMEEEVNNNNIEEDVIELVKCDLVLERKTCTIRETESECRNYFGRKCFLYQYPKTTVTVEKRNKIH